MRRIELMHVQYRSCFRFIAVAWSVLVFGTGSSAAQTGLAAPTATATPTGEKRVWTIEEVLSERKPPRTKRKVRYCQGGRFKPCVCARDVSKLVQYRPAVKECDGNAAIVMSGKYLSIFSVVVRDRENRDRWPTSGFGNCTPYERDVLGVNKCSAFKEQESIGVERADGDAVVHCLGASGYSPLFTQVSRITGKLFDVPTSTGDPVVRWCLVSPAKPLN